MVNTALFVRMTAKPGREADLETFLKAAQPLVDEEAGTTAWFAIRLSESTFAIFDAFPDEMSRETHLAGHVARALMQQAPELLMGHPEIEPASVIAAKLPTNLVAVLS